MLHVFHILTISISCDDNSAGAREGVLHDVLEIHLVLLFLFDVEIELLFNFAMLLFEARADITTVHVQVVQRLGGFSFDWEAKLFTWRHGGTRGEIFMLQSLVK